MKTLCFSLGLLLLAVCCCNAMPEAVKYRAPVKCCLKFRDKPIDAQRVEDVYKTHNSCMKKAFIVTTVRGREICFRQTFDWAVKLFNQHRGAEGSGQHS
ncbi:C-C motif chemokine 3-like [Melanotaenia boesemani]|uniref:C-C motif chemokine 3-like n=1 Tax=Melanotaenia boesemani TaxID=1250792 RepID=UPI001C03E23C|nr:C-C motif chemokine 3-like [Melanotaenia boesemani]